MSISIPYTFVPGTTILSAEVNSNFSTIAGAAINRTGDTLTGNLAVSSDVTIDGVDISDFLTSTQVLAPVIGSASVPSFAMSTDTNTGMYFSASDQLAWTLGGTKKLELTSTGLTTTNGLTVTTDLTVSGNAAVTGTLGVTGVATFSNGDNSFKVGASTETYKGAGVINTDSTQASTAADTNNTTLFSYTLPANAFNANGRVLRFTAWGSFGSNGNTKTVRLMWNGTGGSTLISVVVTSNNQNWILQGTVIRTGSSTQDFFGQFIQSNTSTSASFGTSAATDTSAITLHVTAQNGSASAGDIVYEGSVIEFLS